MSTAFKYFRIIILLILFIGLAFYSKTQKLKSRSWSSPLEIIIYPMNSEDSPIVEDYITQLDSTAFEDIDQFFKDEAVHYELSIEQPTMTQLGKLIHTYPPEPPATPTNFIELAWWSIKFRYWAYQATPDNQSNLHRVRIFVHYHQQTEGKQLQHSLGLNKGLLSIVHAFASKNQEQQNNIVIAHEFLHTVGASDKYNADNHAVFPDGYADPEKEPLFPQLNAEIMSGRIPISTNQSKMAANLKHCIIGNKTASEINWINPSE